MVPDSPFVDVDAPLGVVVAAHLIPLTMLIPLAISHLSAMPFAAVAFDGYGITKLGTVVPRVTAPVVSKTCRYTGAESMFTKDAPPNFPATALKITVVLMALAK